MKRLFIAEKPELGRAIADAIGGASKSQNYITCGNDVVTWCFGHLLELTDPEDHDETLKRWDLNRLPMRWPISHKPIKGKASQVSLIKKLAADADVIVNAGDPDDEGQLLVDEVLEFIGNTKPVKRVLINDNNKKVVQKALSNMRDNGEFYGLYQSALARSVADQIYGYNLTRAYTLAAGGSGTVLSVGRVQTPILGLVVRRDRAHADHKAAFYYNVTAEFNGAGGRGTANLIPASDAPLDDKKRITDQAYAEAIAAAVNGQVGVITDKQQAENAHAAPLPYNLLQLQADCSRKYGLSPKDTLDITQGLREKHKLITYNRSDCQYLSDEQHEDVPDVLAAIAQTSDALGKAVNYANPQLKSRAFNSANVSAHHAIIPTATAGDLQKLSDSERNVYNLIARAYIAQFFPKKVTLDTKLIIDFQGHTFTATSSIIQAKGWAALYMNDGSDDEPDDQDDQNGFLGNYETGDRLQCVRCIAAQKKTQPPPLYTMSTLMKDLARVAKYVTDPAVKKILIEKDKDKKGESGGIGTPATRSAIIDGLIQRGFIAERGKKVISTDLGRGFYDQLPQFATAPDMTALWFEQQEEIKGGSRTAQELIESVAGHVTQEIERIKTTGVKVAGAAGTECPACGSGTLQKRKGKHGTFWGCTNYPDCKTTYPDKRGKPDLSLKPKKPAAETSAHACPKCTKPLIRRKSNKGKGHWYGCSGFRDGCDFTTVERNGQPVWDGFFKSNERVSEDFNRGDQQQDEREGF